ncbi:hypothetical protein GQ55_9G355900 [Panicum hallii var. hallii]|uniref:Uncharacterized protein n=1 Tax=Panicum hallii var. hallii TaxID=1504633 RepID=A0A2T7C8N4_9POAL|nr:hypothetical protein GQ55_9G355900 [Panicum hallii var. hallii]
MFIEVSISNYAEYQGKYAIYLYRCSFIHLLRCLKGLYETFMCSLQIEIRGVGCSSCSAKEIDFT